MDPLMACHWDPGSAKISVFDGAMFEKLIEDIEGRFPF